MNKGSDLTISKLKIGKNSSSDKRAYDRYKLANISHANDLSRRLTVLILLTECSVIKKKAHIIFRNELQEEGANIIVNSVHPGLIMTYLIRHSFWIMGKCMHGDILVLYYYKRIIDKLDT